MIQELSFEQHLQTTKSRTPATVQAYLTDVHRFRRWLAHQGLPDTGEGVTSADINRYLQEHNASAPYHNRVLGSLRAWFDYLVAQGSTWENPAREVERKASPVRAQAAPLTPEEVRRLQEAIHQHARSFEQVRNQAILALLLELGLSTSELLHLTLDDVHTHSGRPCALTIRGSRGKQRQVTLTSAVGLLLSQWLHQRQKIARFVKRRHSEITLWETVPDPGFTFKGLTISKPPQTDLLWLIPAGRKAGWPLDEQGLRFMLDHFGRLADVDKKITPQLLKRTYELRRDNHSEMSS